MTEMGTNLNSKYYPDIGLRAGGKQERNLPYAHIQNSQTE
jgi:hypothetical protein